MPFPSEVTVKRYRLNDCWRTWFLPECEQLKLFGVTEKYLCMISGEHPACRYKIGTLIYLEDAPYFHKIGNHHRIRGPYKVVASHPSEKHKVIVKHNGAIIVYQDLNPSIGPWRDGYSVKRVIEGAEVTYRQIASEFNYFPFRFSIEPATNFTTDYVEHSHHKCDLCYQG